MTLASAYEQCRQVHAQYGRTYYLATLLLPRWKRQHVHALYGLTRHADEIVDDLESIRTTAERSASLRRFRETVFAALANEPVQDPILPAVAHTVRAFDIDHAEIESFFRSMATDLERTEFATYDDLLGYMEGSAAVIGTMMLPILEPIDPSRAREPARQLGFAFQLTNFIRDVGEDLALGRVYLPLEDLRRFSVNRHDLQQGVITPAIRDLLQFEIERARAHYRAALPGIDMLVPSSRPCIHAAATLYSDILRQVERNGYQVLTRRARVPRRRRLQIAVLNTSRARTTARQERNTSAPAAFQPLEQSIRRAR